MIEPSLRPDPAAVVVNWNTPSETIASVRSLLEDGVDSSRVAIVDNGSDDDSCERFTRELPQVRLVRLAHNEGFARANNAGAAAFPAARSYLLVNSDAFVHRPGSVRSLLEALEHERVGLTVPRLLNRDLSLQRSVVALPTPAVAFSQAVGLSRVLPNRVQPSWGTRWNHGRAQEIRSVTGAVLAVRGEVWRALGGLSERAHLFGEDHDLCWRLRKLGWTAWFVPDSEFVHLGGLSTRRVFTEPERASAVAAAEAALIRAHLSGAEATLTLRLRQGGHAVRLFRAAVRRDRLGVAEHRAYLRGFGLRT
jgi:GT2 family glycosyltransferase